MNFTVDDSSKIKRYYQIYTQIADEIKSGKIPAGSRLPSVRMLSESANVSKNTVTKAYSELEKAGFIYSENKRGYFVSEYKGDKAESLDYTNTTEKVTMEEKKETNSIPTVDSILKQYAMNNEASAKKILPVNAEIKEAPALTQAPKEQNAAEVQDEAFFEKYILESYKAILTTPKRKFLHEKSEPFGDISLRKALASFISKFHNINANPENIIVGSGMEMLLRNVLMLQSVNTPIVKPEGKGLLSLANQASEGSLQALKPFAAVAEDTAKSTKQIFLDANIPVREVPVDDQGISFDFLVTSGTTIVYVTPGDIPVGTFEENDQRRDDILEWAGKVSYRHIIEYDTDTSKDAKNLYKQKDADDKVIYINSFSNLLCQGINAAFLILPSDICEDYKQHYANFDCSLSYLDQLALTEFITKGHLESYLNNLEDL